MFNVIRLIDTVDEAARDRLIGKLQTATTGVGADEHLVRPTLAGVRNGGDILMLLRFPDISQWLSCAGAVDGVLADPAVTHVNGATYSGRLIATTEAEGTIYRTLLLRVQPDTDEITLARFENDLRLLPRYVTSIHSWQLSRVGSATGTSPWTHVFEQKFRDLAGLTGPYLMHPIHWAYVDRWFDPECPDVVIRDRVCHSFCALEEMERNDR